MKSPDLRVIIVEDEESVLRNLSAFFEDEGFIVHGAANAEEALHIILAEKIDAGIINIRLPDLDGNSLILKANELRPYMAFVIHTGSIGYTLPRELIDIGVGEQQVFVKPLSDMNILVRAIKDLTMPHTDQ